MDVGRFMQQVKNASGVVTGHYLPVSVVSPDGASGTSLLVPVRVKISCKLVGANVLVAADAAKKIRVLSLILYASGTANEVYLASAATGILGDAAAPMPLDKAGTTGASGFLLNYNPDGWCETALNSELNLYLTNAQYVGGALVYVKV